MRIWVAVVEAGRRSVKEVGAEWHLWEFQQFEEFGGYAYVAGLSSVYVYAGG